ncbi:CHASE3 domain-containing protein, partial [Sphingomonas sp. DT-207]|uniref:CHASE3 domain-containing protein n=1 Tax=Sphingomonas sp. DT-207 TaxID=3396167 RepID=UPI003F19B58D
MSLSNQPISRKLAGAFAALIIVFAIVGSFVFSSLATLSGAAEDKERSLEALRQSQTILTQVLEQQNAARGFALLAKDEFRKTYDENGEKIFKTIDAFKEKSTSPEQHQRADQLVSAIKELRVKLDNVIELARNPATRARAGELSGVKMLGDIRPVIADIQKIQTERVETRIQAEADAQRAAKFAIWLGGFIAVALAGMFGWLLSRTVAKPIREMTQTMNTLAAGNNRVDVPGTDRGDEIGAMAKAVLVFREAAVEK